MSERFTVLQLVHRLHRGTWDYEPPTWAAALHHLAEVAEAVERLEVENQDLKRRLEALEQLVGTLPGVRRVEMPSAVLCGKCGGTGYTSQLRVIGKPYEPVICNKCQGTGRVELAANTTQECWHCQGFGQVKWQTDKGTCSIRCAFCQGTGSLTYYVCGTCQGTGRVQA